MTKDKFKTILDYALAADEVILKLNQEELEVESVELPYSAEIILNLRVKDENKNCNFYKKIYLKEKVEENES